MNRRHANRQITAQSLEKRENRLKCATFGNISASNSMFGDVESMLSLSVCSIIW